MGELYEFEFDQCKDWAKRKRNKNVSWDEIMYACKGDSDGLNRFLESRKEEDDWPEELNEEVWLKMINDLKEAEEKRISVSLSSTIPPNTVDEKTNVYVPTGSKSSWQLYKKHLKNKGFTEDAVDNIEDSCIKILQQLSKETSKTEPVKGLVVGNVQSGKTANMAGLMAMAADWGWNMFIILSGTIENLRQQTQNRLFDDLNHTGNITWQSLNHLSKKSSEPGERLCDLKLGPDSNARYMTICLKVKSRLSDLLEWIQADKNNIRNLKVLVIDDEADQAGINTGDVYSDDDRKTINKLILNLVQCRDKNAVNEETNSFDGKYQAMNYISYTATPYANCLNEDGNHTLYPRNFIHTLGVPFSYFGPQKIFGTNDADDDMTLNIVNEVSNNEIGIINNIHSGMTDTIPLSLENSILWFLCCVSVMRYYDYKKPVSMLIHTSQKQIHHTYVAKAIQNWIEANKKTVVSKCEQVYSVQTNRLDKERLRMVYPDYEHPDSFIWDYPEFKKIKSYIKDIISEISPIKMDDEGELKYNKGLHICVDNCANNGVNDEGMHMRLAYPNEKSDNVPDYATAFIVIGGNTLSRGLTLEGLVSTFFLRSVKQVDTLMQMGRWFGYRPHYELLPRIWMTKDTSEKFRYLADVDLDLREQIRQMMIAGMSPLDFKLTLLTSPKAGWMSLTSKNKMHMAEEAGVDFSGMDTQLTVYTRNIKELKKNIEVADDFLSELGEYRTSTNTTAYIWDDIDFNSIKTGFFDKGFKVPETSKAFQQIDLLNEWIEDQTKKGEMGLWRVLLCGLPVDDENSGKNWRLKCGISIGMINRSCKTDSGDHFNIGVLSGKKDYVADLTEDMFESSSDWLKLKKSKKMSSQYKDFRALAGADKTPLFIVYMIDKNSKPVSENERTELNVGENLIGITMVLPGIRGKHNTVTRLKIKHMDINQEVDN